MLSTHVQFQSHVLLQSTAKLLQRLILCVGQKLDKPFPLASQIEGEPQYLHFPCQFADWMSSAHDPMDHCKLGLIDLLGRKSFRTRNET